MADSGCPTYDCHLQSYHDHISEQEELSCPHCQKYHKRVEHSQREHDINVYNFGACDDDAHDPSVGLMEQPAHASFPDCCEAHANVG